MTSFLATKVPPCCLVPSFSAPVTLLVDMARQGRGITWAPRSLVADDLAAGRLMRAGPEEWDIGINICLFRSRARMTPAAEAFWSAVQKGERGKGSPAKAGAAEGGELEHDPEKWKPVFRKDHAQTTICSADDVSI